MVRRHGRRRHSSRATTAPVQGLNGYALAPTNVTDASGWLWAWALAIPQNAPDPDTAWEYVSWATSQRVHRVEAGDIARRVAGRSFPPGTRESTVRESSTTRRPLPPSPVKTLEAMQAAPIDNPGTTPRPGLPGVQYVGVPEFQDVWHPLHRAVLGCDRRVDKRRRCHLGACQAIASEVSG